jgi:hypothetical protein
VITVTLKKDDVTPALAALRGVSKNPSRIMAAAGRGVANLFKKHLRGLDRSRPNQLGGKRTHFWLEMSRAVQTPEISERTASVTISHPLAAHKHTGGTVHAKRVQLLTIPVHPDAHGRRASVLESEKGIKLFFIGSKQRGWLVSKAEGATDLTFYYLLTPQATQAPDPPEGILPPDEEIKGVALHYAKQALELEFKRFTHA